MATLPGKILRYPILDALGDNKEAIPTQRIITVSLPGKVNKTVKIQNKPLTGDVTILPSDLGVYSTSEFNQKANAKVEKEDVKSALGQSTTFLISQSGYKTALDNVNGTITTNTTDFNKRIKSLNDDLDTISDQTLDKDKVVSSKDMDALYATSADINRGPVKTAAQLVEDGSVYRLENNGVLSARYIWVRYHKWINPNMFIQGILPNDKDNGILLYVKFPDGDSDEMTPIIARISADKTKITGIPKGCTVWVSMT